MSKKKQVDVPEKEKLVELLNSKSSLKQDISGVMSEWFTKFKKVLVQCTADIRKQIPDERVRVKYQDVGDGEAHLFIGSDVIVFYLHTNVFRFSERDYQSMTTYVKNKPENGYCGIIHFYDFLADSYEYNRSNDLGYLIGRLFINRENHFVVEGKGQLGFKYRDFMHQVIDEKIIHDLIYEIAIHAIEFDLLTPPYQSVQQVTVVDMQTLSQSSKMKTGKRLGFTFENKGNPKL